MQVAGLEHVSKRFGKVAALEDVDFAVYRGQLLALLGPNGAGKTTTVRLLLGLDRPRSGRVSVFGRDPCDMQARARRGAMLQVGKAPETLRVREHIQLFSSYYPNPLTMAKVIDAAGLEGLENRIFGSLSGGEKQRVLFALAICGNPDLLILDEPTLGLDVESRRALWLYIRGFVDRGGSVLLTTHYLDEADALAERVIVLHRGRAIVSGSPADIKRRAAARRVRCITSLPRHRIASLPGVVSFRRDGVSTEIVASDADRVVYELFLADPSLHDLEVTGAGLEDAFLAITNDSKFLEAAQ
jgi:ABC-2 type transport system ATP-binding protein